MPGKKISGQGDEKSSTKMSRKDLNKLIKSKKNDATYKATPSKRKVTGKENSEKSARKTDKKKRKEISDKNEVATLPEMPQKKKMRLEHQQETVIEEPESIFLKLPTYLLICIFKYLTVSDKARAAQVCTVWRNASYVPAVWRGATVRILQEWPEASLFPSLVHRGLDRFLLIHLDFAQPGANDLLQYVHMADDITLSFCRNVTSEFLERMFAKEFPRLTGLGLNNVRDVLDRNVELIAKNCPNLVNLSLSGSENLTDKSMECLADRLSKLQSLDLATCKGITGAGIRYLALGSFRNMLRYLNLTWCEAGDAAMSHVANLTALTDLNLSDSNVSDDGFARLANGGSKIERMDISGCQLSDYGMLHVGRMAHLTTLIFRENRITEEGVKLLVEGGAPIVALDLSGFRYMSFCVIRHLCRMVYLRELHITNSPDLRDEDLNFLSNTLITTINFSHTEIGDAGMQRLSNMAYLVDLNMAYSSITNRGILTLSKGRAPIAHLNLTSCPLTDVGLRNLALMVHLRHVNLSHCNRITSKGLVYLAKTAIESLDLSRCKKLGVGALGVVSQGMTALRRLTLDQEHVNNSGLALAANNLCLLDELLIEDENRIKDILTLR